MIVSPGARPRDIDAIRQVVERFEETMAAAREKLGSNGRDQSQTAPDTKKERS